MAQDILHKLLFQPDLLPSLTFINGPVWKTNEISALPEVLDRIKLRTLHGAPVVEGATPPPSVLPTV